MPKRTENSLVAELGVSFLPDHIIKKVDDIFLTYFGLGMVKATFFNLQHEISQFPTKISSLSHTQLGDIHGEYSAWLSYSSDKLKYIAVCNNVVQNEIDKVYQANLSHQSGSGNIEVKKAVAKSEPNYLSLLEYKSKIETLTEMLQNECNRLERCVASLSREISRREANAGY